MKSSLSISQLYASIEGKEVLKGITLRVNAGHVHVIMGPNGSGKSTLAYVLMGHPGYQVKSQKSKVKSGNLELLKLSPEERAKAGLFLAFQSPIAVPGVTVMNLLRTAYQELYANQKEKMKQEVMQNPVLSRRWHAGGMSISEFMDTVKKYCKTLRISESFLHRGIHDGFSGGEKKKIEMLEALMLRPKFAIFDEIDTGLDVDALKIVASGIERLKNQGSGIIIITHYQRILKYITPDVVHILVNGKIVKTADATLPKYIEEKGYSEYV